MSDVVSSPASATNEQADEHLRAAMTALRAGDIMRAAEEAEKARSSDQSARVLIVFAAISHALGRDIDALSMLEQAMQFAPEVGNYPDAAAAILLKLGRKSDGIFNLKLGTHLPSDVFLDEIIGSYFGKIKDIFDSFIENRPLTTARLMMQQGMYAAAMRQLETFVGVSGGDVDSFSLLVECSIYTGQLQEAEVAFSALLALNADHPKRPDYALGIALLKGDAQAVSEACAQLKEVDNLEDALARYRMLEWSPLVDDAVLAEGLSQVHRLTFANPEVSTFSATDWPDTVSVGFLCSYVDSALEGLLLSLKEYIPVKVYFTGTGSSPSLMRVKAALEDFREVAAVDDATLVEMIRFDQVSVLFDTVGAAAFARPGIWRTRMAPIQILWAVPSRYDDLACYDYRLAPSADSTNMRLIDLGVPLRYPVPPAELMGRVAEVRALKVSRDTSDRDVRRLLAPHAGLLISDVALDIYMKILTAVPKATLAFVARSELNDPLVQRVLAAAAIHDCGDRVELIDPSDFLQSRSEIMLDADLILDSFPYGNLEMVTEALWIGSPVLTLKGNNPRSEAAAYLVKAAGFDELISDGIEDYYRDAIDFLENKADLKVVVEKMRNLHKSISSSLYQETAEVLANKIESLWGEWRSMNK